MIGQSGILVWIFQTFNLLCSCLHSSLHSSMSSGSPWHAIPPPHRSGKLLSREMKSQTDNTNTFSSNKTLDRLCEAEPIVRSCTLSAPVWCYWNRKSISPEELSSGFHWKLDSHKVCLESLAKTPKICGKNGHTTPVNCGFADLLKLTGLKAEAVAKTCVFWGIRSVSLKMQLLVTGNPSPLSW